MTPAIGGHGYARAEIEAFIIFVALGLIIGFLTGRWLALLAVPPAVVLLVGLSDPVLPTAIHWWIAFVEGAFTALGVVVGIGARRVAAQKANRS